ncbi:MAG: sugar kinase [Actinomycetaceae bacterium]|nr:sugar kinase [Actinomycetaceae bacterium]
MIDVATFGETMGTIRFTDIPALGGTPRASFAGAESNVAIGLVRLGHKAAWVGTVGHDTFGSLIQRGLRAEQVDVTGARMTDEHSTGLLVSRDAGLGSFAVDYHRSNSAARQITKEQIEHIFALNPTYVHLTGITPALGSKAYEATMYLAREARQRGIALTFDVNYRSRLWSPEEAAPVLTEIARNATIVFGGPEEIQMLTGCEDIDEGVAQLLDYGVEEVVYKSAGAATSVTRDTTVSEPGMKVPVRDTIGAGDAFVAGFLSGKLDGKTSSECLKRGHICGAFAVGNIGDWEGAPSRESLIALELGAGEVLR